MSNVSVGLLDPLADPANANVDIVFVHGLGGHPVNTWTDDTVFWPKQLLPHDIPKARILSFGYRANIVDFWGGPSENRIDNHADDLVGALAALRERTDTVGAAHPQSSLLWSRLGGLVCVQAILSAENRREEHTRRVSQNVRCIAFFGTPHEGSEKAKWADMGRRFLTKYLNVETNSALLNDLETGSQKLAELGREFPNLLRLRAAKENKTGNEIEIMCFFEGKSMKIGPKNVGKIVPEASACLKGYPNRSIHADHSEMVKYDGKDDESYKKVLDTLQTWVKRLQSPETQNEAGGDRYEAETYFTGTFYGGVQHGQTVLHGGENNFGTGGNYYFGAAK